MAELDDNTNWTRAQVECQIGTAIVFAVRMNKNDKTWQHMCRHGQRIVPCDMNGLSLLLRTLN